MRFIFVMVLGFSTSGCATFAPLSYQEQCALDGMKLVGADHGSGSGVSYGSNGSSAIASSRFSAIRCDVPHAKEDIAAVDHVRRAAMPKVIYNDSVPGKRWLTGIGYFVYILPGVALKFYYDHQRDTAIAVSEALARSPVSQSLP